MTLSTASPRRAKTTAPPNDEFPELLRQFPPRPIRSKRQYDQTARAIDRLAVKGERNLTRAQADYLDMLVMLITAYDEAHHPDPPQATLPTRLAALMESAQLNQTQLADLAGTSRGNMSQVLRGHRELSKPQIRRLSAHFALSADYFL